jgi:hypothetical protein
VSARRGRWRPSSRTPRRQTGPRRLTTALRLPLGVALTAWRYMWRTTPMKRHEEVGDPRRDRPPTPRWAGPRDELQLAAEGAGPFFHRRFEICVAEPRLGAEEVMARIHADPNSVCPREFVHFAKVRGEVGRLAVGDEFVVRMPGPWDGPVRVVELDPRSLRMVTLQGHLEAGQIRFATDQEPGRLTFVIETWARSGDRLSDLLYDRLRFAKEVQLHMWTSVLERVLRLAGGRREGPLRIETRRQEGAALESAVNAMEPAEVSRAA